jgi:hypothetical protein
MEANIHFFLYFVQFFLEWKFFSHFGGENKKKSHFISNNFSFSENPAVYEIMWKNIVKASGPRANIIWRMHIACWITKAIKTHSEYAIK